MLEYNGRVNYDSFETLPENWETIADYINTQIDNGDADAWNNYWSAYHANELPSDAPRAIV